MSTETIISDEDVIAAMRAIVAEKGADYVYPESEKLSYGTCAYRNAEGGPSCIVGHLLHRFGLLDRAKEGDGIWGDWSKALPLSKGALRALKQAQCVQDNGRTWGEALAAFEQEMAK